MTRIIKVALNMNKLSVPQKINKTRMIADSILGNPITFPNPIPSIIDLQNATDDLEAAWNEAADGGKQKTALMHDKETDLIRLLNMLAAYVQNIAINDSEVIHLAGMQPKKDGVKHFADFQAVQAAKGAVRLRVKPARGIAYIWETCKDPIGTWVVVKTTTQSTINISNLDEGVKYWFRVKFTGQNGETIPYNPISLIVL
jgi:hypothetical protein